MIDITEWQINNKLSLEFPNALQMAVIFHETYERKAPEFGYETRQDTRAFDPETPNGRLMVAVCEEIIKLIELINEPDPDEPPLEIILAL